MRASAPPIGDSCEVTVIGDSLMAGTEELHEVALAGVGCAAEVDGEGSRSLAYGWQCRIVRIGRRPQVQLLEKRIPGNGTCRPSGLTQLATWAGAGRLGDVVVAALGTNDSGLFDRTRLERNWAEALRLAGDRPVLFLTTQARPTSAQLNRQRTYSEALRQWCASEEHCVLADWATTPAANDPASYIDSVHLNEVGTRPVPSSSPTSSPP